MLALVWTVPVWASLSAPAASPADNVALQLKVAEMGAQLAVLAAEFKNFKEVAEIRKENLQKDRAALTSELQAFKDLAAKEKEVAATEKEVAAKEKEVLLGKLAFLEHRMAELEGKPRMTASAVGPSGSVSPPAPGLLGQRRLSAGATTTAGISFTPLDGLNTASKTPPTISTDQGGELELKTETTTLLVKDVATKAEVTALQNWVTNNYATQTYVKGGSYLANALSPSDISQPRIGDETYRAHTCFARHHCDGCSATNYVGGCSMPGR
jgi:hypothetical protein